MRTRRVVEMTVGLGLMLGPLIYALSLDAPAPTDWCAAATPATAEAPVVEAPAACEPEPGSQPAAPAPPPESSSRPLSRGAELLLVTDAGVVLSAEAERSWGAGRLFEPPGQVSYRVAKRADVAALPSELWELAGRRYDLYGPEGKLCTARLGELRVVAQYDGWGVAGLLGDEWWDEDPERASSSAIRKALWARDDLWLVAEIAADGPCEGALWARDAELPPPSVLRRSDAPNPATAARLAAFADSDAFAELRASYEAEYAALAAAQPDELEYYDDWATLTREHPARAWSWVDGGGVPRLVGLEFGRPPEGCGEALYSWVTALDRIEAGFTSSDPRYGHDPVAVFDADGDGQLELLYQTEDGRELVSATLRESLAVEYDWVCPC